MTEFDETFNTKFEGNEALQRRVLYRLMPREGRIPYFSGGRRFASFTTTSKTDLVTDCRRLLSDINFVVDVSADRLVVGDVQVSLTTEI